jgi:Protein of unknown function (DUF3828)
MKRLTPALFSLLIVVLCGISVVAQRRTATPPVARSPEIVLKEFYTWYVHVSFRETDPFKGKARVTLKKYVSARYIRFRDRNERLVKNGRDPADVWDSDYFLDTQDGRPDPNSGEKEGDWLKSISVSKVALKGRTATAIVTFLDGYPKVKVSLLKEGGVWKIDRVKDARE